MPAQAYSTGPVDIFVGNGGSNYFGAGAGTELGSSKNGVQVQFFHRYEPVMVDFAGSQIAYDKMYEGTFALVAMTLTRYNRTLLDALQSVATPLGNAFVAGTEAGYARGSLMLSEGLARMLWLRQTFAAGQPLAHLAFQNAATGAMPAGWRFPGALLQGPDNETTGTQPNEITLTWECLPLYIPANRSFVLFDRNMTGVGAFT